MTEVEEIFATLAKLLNEDFKDLDTPAKAQFIRSYTDITLILRRKGTRVEENSRVRNWCLSSDFYQAFMQANREKLIADLDIFEDIEKTKGDA